MGNATRQRSTPSSSKRNVEPNLNAIRRRQNQINNEARQLRQKFENIGPKINSGFFNERDLVIMHLIPRRLRELVQEKKMVDRMYWRLIRQQMTHGF